MTTRLIYKDVYDIMGNDKVGLIVLTDEKSTRQITIVCDRSMAVQLGLRKEQSINTAKLLPEVLWTLIERYVNMEMKILINDIKEGEFKTYLCSLDNSVAIPLRASDAVLLGVVTGIPILMNDQVFMMHSTPFHGVKETISVPLTALSKDMLQKALDEAVKIEDYDKATHLRDELRRRDKNTN